MTAPIPPALDYLLGQLETTAEQCKGGDGSNNALRKNGRGEGLRIAKSMIEKAWPAIAAQMDLPLAAEAERLRAALRAVGQAAHIAEGHARRIETGNLPHQRGQTLGAIHPIWMTAESALATKAQPSELWAGLVELLAWLESNRGDLRDWSARIARGVRNRTAQRLRELLGLPPKDGRS